MVVSNRKHIEDLIYGTFSALDPSGNNTNKYQLMFSEMDDKEFEKFIKDFLSNDEENFVLDIVEFEHSLKFEYCEAAAKFLNIPLMEYVFMPHLTKDKSNVIVSSEKCLVGYIHPKRTQQLLHKKNKLAVSNEKISGLTGQVVGNDEHARSSDIEATMLVALGAEKILQELHGPRADDHHMKRQLKQSISERGYATLDELDSVSTNKVTLNTINTYLLCMGFKSDLVSDTYVLPKTSDELIN